MIKPSARALAILALILWVCSLGLVGFTTGGRDETWLGYEILYSGWLGFADSHYAWFANPLLLWAVYAVLKGRRAGFSSCGALLLALDTLRTTQITVDEGGHTAPIYGFGWGAVLWGLAIPVMVAAAGTRALELSKVEGKAAGRAGLLRPIGLLIGVLFGALAVSVNLHQRRIGNDDERTLLKRIAYQVAPICSATYPSVLQPMQSLNGPLEMKFHSDEDQGRWRNPTVMLQWGVPAVRYADRDYTLLRSAEGPILASRPVTGPAAAILDVTEHTRDGSTSIKLSLSDAATSRQLLEQTWTQATPATPWCPRMIDSPGPRDQPRKVMTQALGIASSAAVEEFSFDQYWAVMGKQLKWQVASRGNGEPGQQGTNCPANVGWAEKQPGAPQLAFDPFKINDVLYYDQDRFTVGYRCEGERVYFYRSWGGEDTKPGSELVEARSLSDFHLLWSTKFPLELIGNNVSDSKINIRSIASSDSGIKIDFLDARSGRSLVILLPEVR